ncbi:uncharacterized protein CIMG_04701 [Coccidioides immitis RS]|uniref:Uncharacterized protein n=3 Tax=Coccidioides immitis TaxID=5501 RepID=J3KE15_COCIM|nr:uncharacterized protein CIMG_04701 [Coccidioides immitis RS]EAS33677.3 hypothetical protein CIMG_04701 [Coccidioides immitis RS]KMP04863.1 hypothetical protein CIRG_04544 [Coccidioides immitis RMSCC 2394]KMU86362.1 hypothetical protein CIHG_04151 [Coccidioides immitis H538.4]TPX21339.1 hypothetical protein DIZ76_015295 [Coccidioides immitis]
MTGAETSPGVSPTNSATALVTVTSASAFPTRTAMALGITQTTPCDTSPGIASSTALQFESPPPFTSVTTGKWSSVNSHSSAAPSSSVYMTSLSSMTGSPVSTARPTQFATSTVYSTEIVTVTACPSTVYDCPASQRTTYVTTKTIAISTTVCPRIEIFQLTDLAIEITAASRAVPQPTLYIVAPPATTPGGVGPTAFTQTMSGATVSASIAASSLGSSSATLKARQGRFRLQAVQKMAILQLRVPPHRKVQSLVSRIPVMFKPATSAKYPQVL